MKYSIKINQKAIVDNGFDLDVIDWAILNYIEDFSKSSKLRKTIIEWVEYFRIQYEHMIEEMPMLWIKSKQSLWRRVNKLVNCWILEKTILNWNSTYFRFWENYDLLISDTPVGNKETDAAGLKSPRAVDSKVQPAGLKSPSIKHSTNNTTNKQLSLSPVLSEQGGDSESSLGSNTLNDGVLDKENNPPKSKKEKNKEFYDSLWFSEAITDWIIEYDLNRKKKLNKLTKKWIELFQKDLKSFWGNTEEWMIEVLRRSVARWWEWIFDLDKKNNPPKDRRENPDKLTEEELWVLRFNCMRWKKDSIEYAKKNNIVDKYWKEKLEEYRQIYLNNLLNWWVKPQ